MNTSGSSGRARTIPGDFNSHLLPWFGSRRPAQIDVDFVDRYKAHKLAESARLQKEWDAWRAGRREKPNARPLGPRTINMTLILLSAILDAAEERGLIERNPWDELATLRARRDPSPDDYVFCVWHCARR